MGLTLEIDRTGGDTALLDAVLRFSRDGIMVLDAVHDGAGDVADLVCWRLNPACRRLLDLPSGDLDGCSLLSLLPASRRDGLFDTLAGVNADGGPAEFEHPFRRGGGVVWLGVVAVKSGGRVAVIITDASTVAAKAMPDDTRDELEAANRAIKDMLAALSHEMRTPLNTIIGFADIMRTEMLGPMPHPQYREYIKDICGASHGLLDILNDLMDRKRFEAVKNSERDYRHLIELAPDLICVCRDGRIVLMNPAGAGMLGVWPVDSLIDRPFAEFVHADYRDMIENNMDSLVGQQARVPIKLISGNGREVDVEFAAIAYEEEGERAAVMLIARDVTELSRATDELVAGEERLRRIMETVVDSIITIDEKGIIESFNPASERIFGFTANEVVGKSINMLMPDDEAEKHDEYLDNYIRTGISKVMGSNVEVVALRKDGSTFPADLSTSELRLGEKRIFIGVMRDITERKQAEERLRSLATRHPLTNLPNRNLFRERLKETIARADDGRHLAAILFVDLDNFKDINDSMGHPVGDQVLQAAAVRLLQCVRRQDTVAHFGGDEFTVILDGIAGAAEAATMARKMLERLALAFKIDGKEIFTSASIGVALYPDSTKNPADLLKNVNMATHHAKRQGRNNFQFYTPKLSADVLKRIQIQNGLLRAIERGELEIYYQPKVNLRSHTIVGAEALLRWHSADLGLVMPREFMPVAEESGLIESIGEWVLHSTCAQGVQWARDGLPPLHLAVNLSARQFKQSDLTSRISDILAQTGMDARYLGLELTESMLVENAEATIHILKVLKEMGISLSIDDFGTGYSSLSYLNRFPIDELKVDRSFVANLPDDRNAAAMAKAIVSMARNLELGIVAEGVETERQVGFLSALGCELGQGFLFGPPVPAADFAERMSKSGGVVTRSEATA